MQKIIPHIWLDDQAEEAVDFYVSLFNNSKKGHTDYYDEASSEVAGKPVGSILTIDFTLENQEFVVINGGPDFSITPAISFFVNCQTKEEIDRLWGTLSEYGKVLMPLDHYNFSEKYGWIEDKFGVSWQLILNQLPTQKIIPSLLFVGSQSGKAEEAINFYTTLFENARIEEISRYGAGMAPNEEGTINYASFTLAGQKFAAMESAIDHEFTFTEAVSFLVNCETQEEIDYFWNSMSADPEAEQCGWLKDKFGVSWQIIPQQLNKLLRDPDPEKSLRVMKVFLQMKKLDLAALERAYQK
ncbi:MAG: VOC family protein [Bacillota bacterium]|nr:VOC family protein [Bacillota bacterium]